MFQSRHASVEGSVPMFVVLGGGVCGLYAARVLAREGASVTVLEKEAIPGGLATSHRRGRNFYDLGVHMLHEFDQEILDDIIELMGDQRVEVQLDAKIRWAGSFYRYPLQFGDMVRGTPLFKLCRMIAGLLLTQLRESLSPSESNNAEEALIQLYGRPLYEFFFRDFTHRYWGMPASELSATFVSSKMPRLSATDVIRKILANIGIKEKAGRAVESALLDETLHYSHTGAEAMPRCVAREVEAQGGVILTNCTVEQIEVSDGRATSVSYRDTETGETVRLECDYCISTIPLPWMVDGIDPAPPTNVLESCKRLRYKPIAVYGLLVAKERALDAMYVYYRDRVFHRVGEPKNAGVVVDPPDHTLLIVEMTCEVDDAKWRGDEDVRRQIFADLEAEGICRGEEVRETHILHATAGYPVFDLGFEPHLERVQAYVESISNLRSVGRQGGFCYPNMHAAMRMGADAAERGLREMGISEQSAPPSRRRSRAI